MWGSCNEWKLIAEQCGVGLSGQRSVLAVVADQQTVRADQEASGHPEPVPL